MFKDEADARAVIQRYCVEQADAPARPADVELIVSRLRPQFWIEPMPSTTKPQFRTHFGGAPDLPRGAAWPLRPVPADAQSRAAEFNKHDTQRWAAAHVTRELPFEFVAQIDLAEAAVHPKIADGLPTSGRLHFFWDGVLGLFTGGTTTCKVIWDDAPVARIEAVAIPGVFDELEALFGAGQHAAAGEAMRNTIKMLPETIKIMKSAGISDADIEQAVKAIRDLEQQPPAPDPKFKKPYVYPRRAMKLTPILHLPHARSAAFELEADLSRLLKREAVAECYQILTSNDEGPFDKASRPMRRQRFLGTPDPEQDDPIYAAIDTSAYPPGAWSKATIQDASRQAAAWRLLLQVDIADLTQVSTEGTVYFIIRNDDLARQDFSGVHAYYQQT